MAKLGRGIISSAALCTTTATTNSDDDDRQQQVRACRRRAAHMAVPKFLITRPYRRSCSPPFFILIRDHHILPPPPCSRSTMSPNVAGPDYSPATPISLPRSLKRSSTSSLHSLAGIAPTGSTLSCSPSSSAGTLHSEEPPSGDGLVEGVRHANARLDAR